MRRLRMWVTNAHAQPYLTAPRGEPHPLFLDDTGSVIMPPTGRWEKTPCPITNKDASDYASRHCRLPRDHDGECEFSHE